MTDIHHILPTPPGLIMVCGDHNEMPWPSPSVHDIDQVQEQLRAARRDPVMKVQMFEWEMQAQLRQFNTPKQPRQKSTKPRVNSVVEAAAGIDPQTIAVDETRSAPQPLDLTADDPREQLGKAKKPKRKRPNAPDAPYTPDTLAERWGCSERHVRNLIKRGELRHYKVGLKLLRVAPEMVREYKAKQCSPTPSADTGENGRSASGKMDTARSGLRLARQIAKKRKGSLPRSSQSAPDRAK
jgi:excisionase family DNA binding protein